MSELSPSRLLHEAAGVDNLQLMVHALALGADPNFQCAEDNDRTPLHRVRCSFGEV